MKLFEMKNWKVTVREEVFLLEPFKKLLDKDKSKDKSIAMKELAFIWFFIDFKSDFRNTVNEQDRMKEIIKHVGLPKEWKIDADVIEAMKFYDKMQETLTLKMIKAAYQAVDKINKFFETIDLATTDRSGKPKYNAKQLADTIRQIGPIRKSLQELEIQAKKEMEDEGRLRGGREKGIYVDP